MKIGFFGCGNLGGALLRGMILSGLEQSSFLVCDPSKAIADALLSSFPDIKVEDQKTVAQEADILFLATKPCVAEKAMRDALPFLAKDSILVSCCAGVSLGSLARFVERPWCRIMTNIASRYRAGACALATSAHFPEECAEALVKVLSRIGSVVRVDESHMDTVTALVGSGPAFAFLFIESLVSGAVMEGLDPATARTLATQAVSGATMVAAESPAVHLSELRDRVCSPGGTTIHGIHSLERRSFRATVMDAISSAKARGAALAKIT